MLTSIDIINLLTRIIHLIENIGQKRIIYPYEIKSHACDVMS